MNIWHTESVIAEWDRLIELQRSRQTVALDGRSLDVAQVIAVCM